MGAVVVGGAGAAPTLSYPWQDGTLLPGPGVQTFTVTAPARSTIVHVTPPLTFGVAQSSATSTVEPV